MELLSAEKMPVAAYVDALERARRDMSEYTSERSAAWIYSRMSFRSRVLLAAAYLTLEEV